MNDALVKELTREVRYSKRAIVAIRPGLVVNFYIHGEPRKICPSIADTLSRFIDLVGLKTLAFYCAENGSMKKLDEKRLERDLRLLRCLPKSAEGFDLIYSDVADGGSSGHSIQLLCNKLDDEFPEQVSLIRIELPPNALDHYGEDLLLRFAHEEAVRLGIQSGNIGLGLKRAIALVSEAMTEAYKLLPRYLALDPGDTDDADVMYGHTPWPNWINFVHRNLWQKCGGEPALRREAPSAQIQSLGDLFVIRSSKQPSLGDTNRGAKDIGELPGVARFLKPTRPEVEWVDDDEDIPGMESWSSRLDALELRPWDNSEWVP